MRVLPYGDTAVLAELDDLDAVLTLLAALSAHRPAGVVDLVPGARTLLVRHDGHADRRDIEQALAEAAGRGGSAVARDGGSVEISVRYDGEDLAEVADLTGLSPRGLVEWHTGGAWTVGFAGFSPGFGYLVRDQRRLHVPRRETPRTSVPTGAVALAGDYSGVYPRPSPGGWQVIGHTDEPMWDLDRDPPARLVPGARVSFRAVA